MKRDNGAMRAALASVAISMQEMATTYDRVLALESLERRLRASERRRIRKAIKDLGSHYVRGTPFASGIERALACVAPRKVRK